ncbi:SUMO protease ULP2 NDAI_0A02780 [Naumovozyma dairenensis CBS 421]|uniref:Ubiquitin-like protease family profile domain-containing protein n=1 Tax=Naumovozyma dairenensis (strain ATCC 10597 / BCRC 20456 / CBS 421 / NBRC 0211 / NRRL Y-12639) TaxID=1071378 RepID=G0W3P8_NAUDC|nr:hypothetical protein NDAI_0A02780 [Naumovozyma dairenensis CBS 421]CCD22436.1 hypothetical protein NDAI_0A02780 [Naumovozyma dairenensis CBS 421]
MMESQQASKKTKKPKRRQGAFVPVDNLSSPRSIDIPSTPLRNTAYTNKRRDPKVIEDINNSSKHFLPIPDESVRSISKSPLQNVNVISDEEFEPIHDHTPLKKQRTSLSKKSIGLLLSSPRDAASSKNMNNNSIISIAFNISGTLTSFDVKGKSQSQDKMIMKFTSNRQGKGPRISFIFNGFEIRRGDLDLIRDCKEVIFDENNSCLGTILKSKRTLLASRTGTIVETKCLLWANNGDISDNKIKKIYEILSQNDRIHVTRKSKKRDLTNYLIVEGKEETNFKLAEETLKNAFQSRPKTGNFLKKPLNSLTRRSTSKGLSNFSASHQIKIPRNDTQGGISSSSFYSNSSNSHKEEWSSGLQSLRKSTRKTKNSEKTALALEDIGSEYEVPETFKPSLCYKFDDATSYTITEQDFKCLYNKDWINDTILDFFTKYFIEQSIKAGTLNKNDVSIMSSFFYTKLISDPSNYYGNVKKWVSNSKLFEKKFVVVPINMNYHWFGCIITNLDHLLRYYKYKDEKGKEAHRGDTDVNIPGNEKCKTVKDTVSSDSVTTEQGDNAPDTTPRESVSKNQNEPEESSNISNNSKLEETNTEEEKLNTIQEDISEDMPIVQILTYDSLRQSHTREIDAIKEFIIGYAEDKYNITLDKANIKMKTCLVPQQPNMSDCGVHVILNTKKFFENPTDTWSMWRTSKLRNKNSSKEINTYFEKSTRGQARKKLRNILLALQADYVDYLKGNNIYPKTSDDDISDNSNEDIEIIENYEDYRKESEEQGTKEKDENAVEQLKPLADALKSEPPSPELNRHEQEEGQLAEKHGMDSNNIAEKNYQDTGMEADTENGFDSINAQSDPSDSAMNDTSPERVQYRIVRTASESLSPPRISTRKFLESSPSKKNTSGDEQGVKSKYFGNSVLKSRSLEFDPHQMNTSSSSLSNVSDASPDKALKEKRDISSPMLRTKVVSPSPETSQNIIISDVEDNNDDVNLLGNGKTEHLDNFEQVRADLAKELADDDEEGENDFMLDFNTETNDKQLPKKVYGHRHGVPLAAKTAFFEGSNNSLSQEITPSAEIHTISLDEEE